MVKKCCKSKSKRQTCRQKYKVQRKVAEHHRKVRKEQRKKKAAGVGGQRARLQREVHVPSEAPFREKVLAEAEAARRETNERRIAARQALRSEKRKNLADIMLDAKRADDAWQKKQDRKTKEAVAQGVKTVSEPFERSAKAFHRELEKVLSDCDVFLEVLDARDPLGSRCLEIEERVRGAGKHLVLILNKVDLIPRDVASRWLSHLRRDAPTLAFKASVQQQANRLSHAPEHFLLTKPDAVAQCVGAQPLLRFLGALSRSHGGERASLTAGVIGLPNTGKSSLINSLKREKVCGVGAVPGLTRHTQVVSLDKHLRLMDCPGVVLEKPRIGVSAAQLVLRNCVRPEDVEDPEPAIAEILRHCEPQRLQLHYGLAPYSDAADFLVRFARRCGMLRKGGRPDVVRAGRRLLHDWAQGRLAYYTEPPASEAEAAKSSVDEVRLIQEFSKEFDLNSMDQMVLSESRSAVVSANDLVIPSFGSAAMASEDQDEKEIMLQEEEEGDGSEWTESEVGNDEENDEEAMSTDDEEPSGGLAVLRGMEPRVREADQMQTASLSAHLQQNRALRQQQKKMAKKQRQAAAVVAENDSDVVTDSSDSDYDFEEHFLV